MNDLERAVVEAALSWSWTPSETGKLTALSNACAALRTSRGPDAPMEQFIEEIRLVSVRAANVLAREHQASLGRYGFWRRTDSLRQLACLSADDIIGTRNAGPSTWKVWRDGLRAHGLEPIWQAVIGDE